MRVRLELRPGGTRHAPDYPGQLAKLEGFGDSLWEATATAESLDRNLAVVPAGDYSISVNQNNRELLGLIAALVIVTVAIITAATVTNVVIVLEAPDNVSFESSSSSLEFGPNGKGKLGLKISPVFLNEDQSGLCEGCTLHVEAGDCISGDCDNYDQDAVNDVISPTVSSPLI